MKKSTKTTWRRTLSLRIRVRVPERWLCNTAVGTQMISYVFNHGHITSERDVFTSQAGPKSLLELPFSTTHTLKTSQSPLLSSMQKQNSEVTVPVPAT
jgi:hypothetical protein